MGFAPVIVDAARPWSEGCHGSDTGRDRCGEVDNGLERGAGGDMIAVAAGVRVSGGSADYGNKSDLREAQVGEPSWPLASSLKT